MFRSLPEAFEVSELFSALLFDVNSRTAHLRPPFLGVPCASPPPMHGGDGGRRGRARRARAEVEPGVRTV